MASSNIMAIALLSLGLTFGCITLVLWTGYINGTCSQKKSREIQGWFMALTSLGGIWTYVTGLLIQNASSPMSGFSFLDIALVLLFGGLVLWAAVRPKKVENIVLDDSGLGQVL